MKKKKVSTCALSVDTVKHVATLARLELSKKEIKKFSKDLNDILLAFKDLDSIKTDVEPSFQPLPIEDILRDDVIEQCLTQERALANTKHKEKKFFKGPRAV